MAHFDKNKLEIILTDDDKKELTTPVRISKSIMDKILFGKNYKYFNKSTHENNFN